jgi:hypothetical protein
VDYQEVTQYPVGTLPDSSYQKAASILGQDYAPTGMLVYQSNTFGGLLKNKILMARYSGGSDIVYLVPSADGTKLTLVNAVGLEGLAAPVDIVEDPRTGNIYVSQYADASQGGMNILLLKVHDLPQVSAIRLMNASTGANLAPFKTKTTYNLAELPPISLRVDTKGPVNSVVFTLDGVVVRTESTRPFAINGNNPDLSYIPWTPSVGAHILTLTPYEGANATGFKGPAVTLSFTITNKKLFKLNVNFQNGGNTFVYPKFRTDTGGTFAKHSNGFKYGWSANNAANAFNRNSSLSPDERFDTGIAMKGNVWQATVPNGTYAVWISAGDPTDLSGNYGIAVEGITAITGKLTTKKRWLSKSLTVKVKDGKLTIAPLAGSSGNKINMIQISQIA